MIWNYLKVAWRTLRKHPVYAFVNVLGLGIATATCMLIGLYVQDELNYDIFHPDAHRTLILTLQPEGTETQRFAPSGFASLLKNKVPGVEHVTRTITDSEVLLSPQSKRRRTPQESRVLRADSSFFDVFPGFPVRRADRDEALDAPGEAVLSASAARSLSTDLPSESVLAARLATDGVEEGIAHLRGVTEKMAPGDFFEYTFLDDRFDQMYEAEERLGRIFLGFALIAVVLAGMGLFGLASYAVQRRTQEFGIRKTLGATGTSILGLLSREYGLLMGVALLAGMPLAYLGVERWLRAYACRVGVSAGALASTVGFVMLIAAASIGYHGLRAVRTDPARTLRQE